MTTNYQVTVEYTAEVDYIIDANSPEEAEEKAYEEFKTEHPKLEPDHYHTEPCL